MKKKYKPLIALIFFAISIAVWAESTRFQTTITGLQGDALTNAKTAINNAESKLPYPLTDTNIQDFTQKAPGIIQKAIEPYGYFKSKVISNIYLKDRKWFINLTVNPGPSMKITNVRIELLGPGRNDPAFLKIINKPPIQVGETLNVENYDKAKQMLFNVASQKGYFKAKMQKSKMVIDIKKNRAQIIIRFYTGPRYRFGKTTFSQLPLSLKFLRKFLLYHQGEYYDYKLIEQTQQNLIDSDYFDVVTVNPKIHHAKNHTVPVHIRIFPRPAKQYIFGLGYGSDTGPRGTLGIDLRRVNSKGDRFNTLLQASPKNSSLVTNYFIPGPNPARDLFVIGAGFVNLDISTGSSRSGKFALSYITSFGLWKQNVALTYLNENYNLLNFPRTRARLIYPSISWSYLNADNSVRPNKGISFVLHLAGTPFSLNKSKGGFFQAYVQIRTLYTLPIHTRLLARTSLGHTSIEDILNLPLSLQLLAGGADSVRGYSYNSIGPGRNLFVGSFEIQQRVYGNWYIAGFVDAGNVTDGNPFENLRIGVGPAIMWLSPVGAIELSAARTFNLLNNRWKIQFSMGPQL